MQSDAINVRMEKPIQISADEVVQLQNEKLIKYTNLAQGEPDAVEATQIGLIDKSLDVYSVANLRDEKLFGIFKYNLYL